MKKTQGLTLVPSQMRERRGGKVHWKCGCQFNPDNTRPFLFCLLGIIWD